MINSLKTIKAVKDAISTNLGGKKVRPKLLIIESDDWGSIRTPSMGALQRLSAKGIDHSSNIYKYDALASNEDLENLFAVLTKFKDLSGSFPRITANTIIANPDFDRIKESGYEEYFYELFPETLLKYPDHSNAYNLWKEGIETGIWKPQFHGREHLNILRWLMALKYDKDHTRTCFDERSTSSGIGDYSFMEAYDFDYPNEIQSQQQVIEDGLNQFEKIFGYRSLSFIPPCYNWHPDLEPFLANQGIRILQGGRNQLCPTGKFGEYKKIPHRFGERSEFGMIYNVRNVTFEPTFSPGKDWVNSALAQIAVAFKMKRPAVICSHRINYIGYIDRSNRDRGLRMLHELIKRALKMWPDIKFATTDELLDYIYD